MGLVFGILAVVLVLFLIFAMAMAEWADKDLGELFAGWGKKTLVVKQSLSQTEKIIETVSDKPVTDKIKPGKEINKAVQSMKIKRVKTKKALKKVAKKAKSAKLKKIKA